MGIERPVKAVRIDRRDTSRLYFSGERQGEYVVRGAICWPQVIQVSQTEQVYRGFAVLGAELLGSEPGALTVFEEQEFVCLDHVLDRTGRIQQEGLASWLNQCWVAYGCRTFFWYNDQAVHDHHGRKLRESTQISPRPQMVRVGWESEQEPVQRMYDRLMSQRLAYGKETALYQGIERHVVNPLAVNPERLALLTLVQGMEVFPWRPRRVKGDEWYWDFEGR